RRLARNCGSEGRPSKSRRPCACDRRSVSSASAVVASKPRDRKATHRRLLRQVLVAGNPRAGSILKTQQREYNLQDLVTLPDRLLLMGQGVNTPLPGHSSESMHTPVGEAEPRTDREIVHRARHKDLPTDRHRVDPIRNMDGE